MITLLGSRRHRTPGDVSAMTETPDEQTIEDTAPTAEEEAALRANWEQDIRDQAALAGVSARFLSFWEPQPNTWSLFQDGGLWSVRYVGADYQPALFAQLSDAAFFLKSKLRENAQYLAREFEEIIDDRDCGTFMAQHEPGFGAFADKRIVSLRACEDFDHYGHYEDTILFAAGTPFEQRSQPEEDRAKPYRRFRLLQALTLVHGVAKPAYGQPGGGWAYMFGQTIGQALGQGTLVELSRFSPCRAPSSGQAPQQG
ncbi:DUF4237 domain-containing protein [Pseudonocardiaceae bacterium YIM PH 21723]|nr:DUF4237 domain-containing protein [Pseudonocardiaceae bacterium YIM PH 21723]